VRCTILLLFVLLPVFNSHTTQKQFFENIKAEASTRSDAGRNTWFRTVEDVETIKNLTDEFEYICTCVFNLNSFFASSTSAPDAMPTTLVNVKQVLTQKTFVYLIFVSTIITLAVFILLIAESRSETRNCELGASLAHCGSGYYILKWNKDILTLKARDLSRLLKLLAQNAKNEANTGYWNPIRQTDGFRHPVQAVDEPASYSTTETTPIYDVHHESNNTD
jgi:hypothetical protein